MKKFVQGLLWFRDKHGVVPYFGIDAVTVAIYVWWGKLSGPLGLCVQNLTSIPVFSAAPCIRAKFANQIVYLSESSAPFSLSGFMKRV